MINLSYAHYKIEEAIEKKECIIIACKCEVWYSGRAESFTPEGDRILIIKPDGTFLIHQPKGNAPVNYMKEGAIHSVSKHENCLFINSSDVYKKEYIDIKATQVYFFQSHLLEDNQKIQLSGSEKDMSDMIYAKPELIEKGFKPLSREEHTKYGFIDVFGYDKDNILVVVECKRYNADLGAVTQLRRYVEKIKEAKGIHRVRGIIASPKISPNSLKMLTDWGFEYRAINPPKYLERYNNDQKSIFDF